MKYKWVDILDVSAGMGNSEYGVHDETLEEFEYGPATVVAWNVIIITVFLCAENTDRYSWPHLFVRILETVDILQEAAGSRTIFVGHEHGYPNG